MSVVFPNKGVWTAQTTTVRTVKGSAGHLGTIVAYNPNSAVSYLQFFDVAGTVTLGTTVANEVFGVPPLSTIVIPADKPASYYNAIKFACSTTATGNTAPSTGLDVTVRWS